MGWSNQNAINSTSVVNGNYEINESVLAEEMYKDFPYQKASEEIICE